MNRKIAVAGGDYNPRDDIRRQVTKIFFENNVTKPRADQDDFCSGMDLKLLFRVQEYGPDPDRNSVKTTQLQSFRDMMAKQTEMKIEESRSMLPVINGSKGVVNNRLRNKYCRFQPYVKSGERELLKLYKGQLQRQ